jgi:hypothetical protein
MTQPTPFMPERRRSDSRYAALYTILERVQRAPEYLTADGLDKEAMSASRHWDPWERTMVKAALALFDEGCIKELREERVRLPDLMRDLDDGNLSIVLQAITIARGWRKARPSVPVRE